MMAVKTYNHFKEYAKQMHKAASDIVYETALDINNETKKRSPYITGNLRRSVYFKTKRGSSYGEAHIENPRRRNATMFPEIPFPVDDLTAYVAVAASYAFFVEYGTRKQAAQPFFTPAVAANKAKCISKLERIHERIKIAQS
jgi:HK97 gp10 family phage protein